MTSPALANHGALSECRGNVQCYHSRRSRGIGNPMTSTPCKRSNFETSQQQSILLIAAFMATSDMLQPQHCGSTRDSDAGLTTSETWKFSQLYAHVGFPRSLNALNELMTGASAQTAALTMRRA